MQPLCQWKSNDYYTAVCAFVALYHQNAMHMHHMLPASLCNIVPHYLMKAQFLKKHRV